MKSGGQEVTVTLQARDDWGHPSHSDWGEGVAACSCVGLQTVLRSYRMKLGPDTGRGSGWAWCKPLGFCLQDASRWFRKQTANTSLLVG